MGSKGSKDCAKHWQKCRRSLKTMKEGCYVSQAFQEKKKKKKLSGGGWGGKFPRCLLGEILFLLSLCFVWLCFDTLLGK